MDLLFQACLSFLKIGAFSFGGGYAVLAFIQEEVVELHRWISPTEFVDIVAIAEMTPGPIAVNSSTFVGYQLLGVWGGILLSFCTLLIPFILSLNVAIYSEKFKDNKYLKKALEGIRPGVIGIIAAASFSIGRISLESIHSIMFFALALLLVWKAKISPIIVLGICGVLGIAYYGYILPVLI